MFENPHKSAEAFAERANPKAYVADAARLAISEMGTEFKLGSKNEEIIIKGIEEALVRYAPGEAPRTAQEWKQIAAISGEELIRDLAILGFTESDAMIAKYREAIDEYLKYTLEKKAA